MYSSLVRQLRLASHAADSPLGRGALTATLKREDIKEGDFRATNPRFAADAWEANQALFREIEVAKQHNTTPSQISLAWLLHKNVYPIPGTTKSARIDENFAARNVKLSPAQVAELDAIIEKTPVRRSAPLPDTIRPLENATMSVEWRLCSTERAT